jgi:hypothetical protein
MNDRGRGEWEMKNVKYKMETAVCSTLRGGLTPCSLRSA